MAWFQVARRGRVEQIQSNIGLIHVFNQFIQILFINVFTLFEKYDAELTLYHM